MLQQMIKDTREKLGRALESAKALGKETREAPDDSAKREAFEKAAGEVTKLTGQLRSLEQQAEVERQAEEWNRPAGPFQHRGGERPTMEQLRLTRLIGQSPLARYGIPTTEEFKAVHREAFYVWVKSGNAEAVKVLQELGKLGPAEVHALLGTQGDLGGFLIPEDFRAEVIKDLAAMAVVRGLARVIPTSSSVLVMPAIQSRSATERNYSSGYTGAWKPEGYVTGGTAPPTQDQPKFGQERIPVHVWQPDAIEVSTELMADSAAPLDTILAEVIAETRALDEDAAFINGTGVGQPRGLLHANSSIIEVISGTDALVTYAGLVDVFAAVPAQYRQNSRWMMNSATFAQILKLVDTQQRPIFTPNEIPGNLWTRPMVFSEFMPDPAEASKSILLGDFRYYGIADRQELRLQRLLERFAPNIGILPTARLGGQVLRPAAFRILALKN